MRCCWILGCTRFVEVKTDRERFVGLTSDQIAKEARKIIHERFVGKVIGIDNPVFVNGVSASEYIFPSKPLTDDMREIKSRAAPELDNLLDAGKPLPNEPDSKDGHIHPDAIDFSYFETIFKVGNEFFVGIVNVKNIKRGKLLKDITKIRNITQAIISSYGQNPKSKFLHDASMNSIRNSGENVNSKYMNAVNSGDIDTA